MNVIGIIVEIKLHRTRLKEEDATGEHCAGCDDRTFLKQYRPVCLMQIEGCAMFEEELDMVVCASCAESKRR